VAVAFVVGKSVRVGFAIGGGFVALFVQSGLLDPAEVSCRRFDSQGEKGIGVN
jgi:hypothetical protein